MDPWLSLFLWPGLIASISCLVWLYSKGLRRSRIIYGLYGIIAVWGLTVALATFQLWETAFLAASLSFTSSIILVAFLARRSINQAADIKRMKRIVESRSDRVAALGHEIRTPLAMIKGATDLLLEGNPGPLTPQQLTFLQTISQNSETTISLAEDLLVQARIEAGLFKLRLDLVDIKSVVRSSLSTVRALINSRNQTVKLDYPQVMEYIHADPRLINQVMVNLLQNASKHTSMGGHIYVTIVNNDNSIVVAVLDDGAGMSPEERQKLFQRFSSGRPLGDGTGIGLMITRQIIELHGGQIMVDTTLGRGTTVLFTLPRYPAKEENGQTSSSGSG
jgi:signal transduction histidine kinase